MLPPVLEIYLVWHPADDENARAIAEKVIDHYHGDLFSGLIGGAVEVCLRSAGWTGTGSAPRPILLPEDAGPPRPAAYVAIVPMLGNGLARALSNDPANPWHAFLARMKDASQVSPDRLCIRAVTLDRDAPSAPALAALFADKQFLAGKDPLNPADDTMLLRDMSQSLAQFIDGSTAPIQVFISHTKHIDAALEAATKAFIKTVRDTIQTTRLAAFFDSQNIQAGEDWAQALKQNATTGAMLSLRTDCYAGREWCQREVATAKTSGIPVVVLDALERGEKRGSFLLDHLPRIPARRAGPDWELEGIRRGLALLVDECLKRALWRRQQELAGPAADISWWAPHAPEPLTLTDWLSHNTPSRKNPVIVLHPDPPLTACEVEMINAMAALAGLKQGVEALTPRSYAARGGGSAVRAKGGKAMITPLLPRDALMGKRLGLSASDSPDMARLGLDQRHFRLALGELARLVLVGGGTLAWGGHLQSDGLTPFLIEEVRRFGRKDGDPLLVCLAWSVHREASLDEIERTADTLGLHGRLICLDITGTEMRPEVGRGRDPEPIVDPLEQAKGLTALRKYLCRQTHGRLMIGGKRAGFGGRRPGLIEEAGLTLAADQPLYLAAGFGGATADIARAVDLNIAWFPADLGAEPPDPRLTAGLADIVATATAHPLRTGLDATELAALAATHRPSEVATLVSRGLGRVFRGR